MNTKNPSLIAIMGPTASGKSELAEALAERMDAQLINADAFQVYRGMDIGTGKPAHKDRYLLLDLISPSEQFGLGQWLRFAISALEELFGQGRNAIVVGGTGLYIRALMEEYKDIVAAPDASLRASLVARDIDSLRSELRAKAPGIYDSIDVANPLRVRRALEKLLLPSFSVQLPALRKLKFGVDPPAEILRPRIEARLDRMLLAGWVEEVRRLLDSGVARDSPGMKGLGYRSLAAYVCGEVGMEDAASEILTQTVQYAKRQRTWLRSEPGLVRLQWSEDADDLLTQIFRVIDGDRW